MPPRASEHVRVVRARRPPDLDLHRHRAAGQARPASDPGATCDHLLRSGLSAYSAHRAHTVLRRALTQAMNWGLINRNLAAVIAAPRPVRREMKALSLDQLKALFAASRTSRFYPLWVILGTAGLRLGEALGLGWEDVDFGGGRLVVKRALQRRRGGGLVFVNPKTAKSRRSVHLTGFAVDALREQWLGQAKQRTSTPDWKESGLVFTNLHGHPMESGVVGTALKRVLHQAELPPVRVHDLRHTTASVLLAARIHPKVVQELLGHSTITTTLDTYSHLTPVLHEEAAHILDLLLGWPGAGSAHGVDTGDKSARFQNGGAAPGRHLEQVVVVADDQESSRSEGEFQDSIVFPVATIANGGLGDENRSSRSSGDLHQSPQIELNW